MMDVEVKEKWVAALKGGEYSQGHGGLRSKENTFCCMGVLCDIQFSNRWVRRPGERFYFNGSATGSLSDEDLADVGLDWREQAALINMNDSEAKTFAQIAEFIEEYL